MQETQEAQVRSLGWEDPLEKELTIHSSKLAWEIPRTEEPGRLQSMGLQRVRHGWEFQYYFASNTNLPQKFPKGQVYLLKAYRVVIYSIALTHFFPMVISGSLQEHVFLTNNIYIFIYIYIHTYIHTYILYISQVANHTQNKNRYITQTSLREFQSSTVVVITRLIVVFAVSETSGGIECRCDRL